MFQEPIVVSNPALFQRFFSDPKIATNLLINFLTKLYKLDKTNQQVSQISISNNAIYVHWQGEAMICRYSIKVEGRVVTPCVDELPYSDLFFNKASSDFWA